MKAIRIHSYGNEGELVSEEVPKPEFKPNEVLVRVHDAGVNPIDWKIRAGFMKEWMPATFPMTMGQDFAGEVVEVGQKVKDYAVGDRVFGFAKGAYAEFVAAPEAKIAAIPESVEFKVAASLPTPGLTAYQIIVNKIKCFAGQRILIHGAAGAVGSLAVQIAKFHGAYVATTASDDDATYLLELGADRVIDYKAQPFEEFFHDFDAVVDLVGGTTLSRSYQCVKRGGVVVSTVGPVNQDEAKKYEVQAIQFMMDPNAEDLKIVALLAKQGKIKPRLSVTFPLDKAKEAQDLNQSGKSHGKIILQMT